MKLNKQFLKGMIFSSVLSTMICSTPLVANEVSAVFKKVTSKIVLNGEEYITDNDIYICNGVTYVPLREFSNMVGVNINYQNSEIKIDTISKNSKSNIIQTLNKDESEEEIMQEKTQIGRTEEESLKVIRDLGLEEDSDLAKEILENPTLDVSHLKPSRKKTR